MRIALVTLAFIAVRSAAQDTPGGFKDLEAALAINDVQLQQMQQTCPSVIIAPTRPPQELPHAVYATGTMTSNSIANSPFNPQRIAERRMERTECVSKFLNDAQRAKVKEIAGTMYRWNEASTAFTLGLIRREQWPFGPQCPSAADTSNFPITEAQRRLLSQPGEPIQSLRAQIAEDRKNAYLLWSAGRSTKDLWAKIAQEEAEVSRVWRELGLSLLDDAQKQRLASLETRLQLASEALAAGVIACPWCGGEPLCQ
jgi:hypothetical protein